jgi:hypothetical protein
MQRNKVLCKFQANLKLQGSRMMASLAINKTHSSYSSTGKNLKKEQGDAKKRNERNVKIKVMPKSCSRDIHTAARLRTEAQR